MKNKNIIIAAIVFLVFVIMSKKRAFDSMELKPSFPRNLKLSGTTLTFDLPFTAFNGSNGTLNLGGIDLRIYAENKYIGRAFASGNQQVLPFGQSVLYTKVFISLIDLAAAMPGFLNGVQDQAVDFLFRGVINVEGIYANVDIPFAFNLPKFN